MGDSQSAAPSMDDDALASSIVAEAVSARPRAAVRDVPVSPTAGVGVQYDPGHLEEASRMLRVARAKPPELPSGPYAATSYTERALPRQREGALRAITQEREALRGLGFDPGPQGDRLHDIDPGAVALALSRRRLNEEGDTARAEAERANPTFKETIIGRPGERLTSNAAMRALQAGGAGVSAALTGAAALGRGIGGQWDETTNPAIQGATADVLGPLMMRDEVAGVPVEGGLGQRAAEVALGRYAYPSEEEERMGEDPQLGAARTFTKGLYGTADLAAQLTEADLVGEGMFRGAGALANKARSVSQARNEARLLRQAGRKGEQFAEKAGEFIDDLEATRVAKAAEEQAAADAAAQAAKDAAEQEAKQSALRTRAAEVEASLRGKPPVQPPATTKAEMASVEPRFKQGDSISWMEQVGELADGSPRYVRRYGTVEKVTDDARTLAVRGTERRTPVRVAADEADLVRAAEPPAARPAVPEPDAVPVETPRTRTPQERRQPGIAPEEPRNPESGMVINPFADVDPKTLRRAARGALGATSGWLAAVATDTNTPEDDFFKISARRLLYAAIGAAGMQGSGASKVIGRPLSAAAARVAEKAPEGLKDFGRKWFASPIDRIGTPESAATLRRFVDSKREAHLDAIAQGDRLAAAKAAFPDAAGQNLVGRYMEDAPGAAREMGDALRNLEDEALAQRIRDSLDDAKAQARSVTRENVDAGTLSREVGIEKQGGYLKRIPKSALENPETIAERAARKAGVVGRLGKLEYSKDAYGGVYALGADEVRKIIAENGIPSPEGKARHLLEGDDSRTLVKWEDTPEGEAAHAAFRKALEPIAFERSLVPVSAGRLVGGGDETMIAQAGKGASGDIGDMAQRKWDDRTLSVKMPPSIIDEAAKAVGVTIEKNRYGKGGAWRVQFATPEDSEQFLGGLRSYAIGNATFDVTPQAKRWLQQRLRGSAVPHGPGARGGLGKLEIESFSPRTVAEQIAEDIQDPVARAHVSHVQSSIRAAKGRFYDELATGADAKGAWAIEPTAEQLASGKNLIVGPNGREYVVYGPGSGRGALEGMAVRKDWHDLLTDADKDGTAMAGFISGAMSQWKKGILATPSFTMMNLGGNMLSHWNTRTMPWRYPRTYKQVASRFIEAARTGSIDPIRSYMREIGFTIDDTALSADPEAAELIEALLNGGTREAQNAYKRYQAGKRAMEIAQQGIVSGKGLKGVALHAGVSGGVGAAYGAASAQPGEGFENAALGAAYGVLGGAAASAAARLAIRVNKYIDPMSRAFAYEVMTKEHGLSKAEALDQVRRHFQNYEEANRAARALSGKTSGAASVIANPFFTFYSELLRNTKNAMIDNPARATMGLLAYPTAPAINAYLWETFKNPDERNKAVAAHPGAFFRKTEDGVDWMDAGSINPVNNVYEDLSQLGRDRDWRSLIRVGTMFGGSTPIMAGYDAARVLQDRKAKHLRFGTPLAQPDESRPAAAGRILAETASNPLTPYGGRTANRVEEAITQPYKRGRVKKDAEPVREVVRAMTGVRSGEYDVGEERLNLKKKYAALIREVEEELQSAMSQANVRADADRRVSLKRDAKREVQRLKQKRDEELERITPQPVGGGR